jgi:hypothetical protein
MPRLGPGVWQRAATTRQTDVVVNQAIPRCVSVQRDAIARVATDQVGRIELEAADHVVVGPIGNQNAATLPSGITPPT